MTKIFQFGFKEGAKWSWSRPFHVGMVIGKPFSFYFCFILAGLGAIDIRLKDHTDFYREEVGGLIWFSLRLRMGPVFDVQVAVPVFWRPKITRLQQCMKENSKKRWCSAEAGSIEVENER